MFRRHRPGHAWAGGSASARMRYPAWALLAAASLVWTIAGAHEIRVENPAPVCGFGDLRFDAGFEGGRINECRQVGVDTYSLGVSPENRPVNPSPWYAFRVMAETGRRISVWLHYGLHQHRYAPRISQDGENWQRLPEAQYRVALDGRALLLRLRVGPTPLYVSAQEIIDNADYVAWMTAISERASVQMVEIGRSHAGRPIVALTAEPGLGLDFDNLATASQQMQAAGNTSDTGSAEPALPRDWVLLTGRQHPPEIPGALAMRAFIERLVADDTLADKFRARFRLLMIPNLNPDGVARGHWRHNLGGVDLNRDWGPFSQPETAAVARLLSALFETGGQRLWLGLDFHATHRNVFYTQEDGEPAFLPGFTADWLRALAARLPQYDAERAPSANAGRPVFKHYISETYGIPAITYEVGDQTEREMIDRSATVAAEEMMRLLLEAASGGKGG